jgi:hypothetical protein
MGSSYLEKIMDLHYNEKAKQMGNRSANEIINKNQTKEKPNGIYKPLAVGFTIYPISQ